MSVDTGNKLGRRVTGKVNQAADFFRKAFPASTRDGNIEHEVQLITGKQQFYLGRVIEFTMLDEEDIDLPGKFKGGAIPEGLLPGISQYTVIISCQEAVDGFKIITIAKTDRRLGVR